MSFFEETVNEIVAEFETSLSELIAAKNTIAVSSSDPPLKKVTSYPIHRNIFAKAFGKRFLPNEKVNISVGSLDARYKLSTLSRVETIFNFNTLNFNKYGDFCILSPMMAVQKKFDRVKVGQLVVPLKETSDGVLVFVPGDADEENAPFIKIKELIDGFKPSMLPEKYLEGRPITTKKGQDFVSLAAGHPLEEGDYLIVFGKPYEVHAVTDDDCFTTKFGERSIVRTRHEFSNNVTRQRFRYKKVLSVCGYVTTIATDLLLPHNPVEVTFTLNKKGNNHGVVNILFHNIVFNEMGFMMHDRFASN